MYIYITWHR